MLSLDGWLYFRAPARIAVLVNEVKKLLDKVLDAKVECPQLDISDTVIVKAMIRLLTNDNMINKNNE